MGNRGILHDDLQRLGSARWRHKAWICCVPSFKGRRRVPMSPGAYTELFFLDEAVALAAGHRPCAECRRAAFDAFRDAWAEATGSCARAPEIDRALHRARVTRNRTQVRQTGDLADLPDGTFILRDGRAHLVLADRLLPFTTEGYGSPLRRPSGAATILTPAPTLTVLRHAYRPQLHPTAGRV